MDNLNAGIVSRLRTPRPPTSEQHIIAGFVTQEASACEGAIERANDEINLIREYRMRLIADVVTGKLDVRESAVHLKELAADSSECFAMELDQEVEQLDTENNEAESDTET